MIPIRTANEIDRVAQHGHYIGYIEMNARANWGAGVYVNWETHGEIVPQIWRSSWRVKCPFCAGSVFYEPGYPFFCPDCVMGQNGGYAMAVLMPAPEERQIIEQLLLDRPDPLTRNWLLGESIHQLLRENTEHGL